MYGQYSVLGRYSIDKLLVPAGKKRIFSPQFQLMKTNTLLFALLASVLVLAACSKEFSAESSKVPSTGSLRADGVGDCLPKNVVGVYEANKELDPDANYLEVEVEVYSPGSYEIYTDTINGIWFRASGLFTSPGIYTVELQGYGTPVNSNISNFVVSYSGTECTIAVTIFPEGGGGPAEIELAGSPNTCTDFNLEGAYVTGTPLTSSNTVTLKVNVLTPGTYNITTTLSNGITFAGAGAFLNTGSHTVTLTGNGTPLITGPTNVPITVGNSTCSFTVDVVGPAAYTFDCATAIVVGTYVKGVELDASHSVILDVDVTQPGGYNITATINGMTFSAAGDFTAAGPAQVTLIANGIPTNEGTYNVPLSGGGNNCTFELIVEDSPNASGTWTFTAEGTTWTGTINTMTIDYHRPGFAAVIDFTGTTASGHTLAVVLTDITGYIFANEHYRFYVASIADNWGYLFLFNDPSSQPMYKWDADDLPPDMDLTFVTTSIDETSDPKTISMTFSGTITTPNNGPVVNITNGSVNATFKI